MGNGTELGRVRGLGSARYGSKHWIDQRLTAVGNLLLAGWLVLSLLLLPNFEYETVANWLAQPLGCGAHDPDAGQHLLARPPWAAGLYRGLYP
jgi:hypothetical protein